MIKCSCVYTFSLWLMLTLLIGLPGGVIGQSVGQVEVAEPFPGPRLTAEQAVAVAINTQQNVPDSYQLRRPHYLQTGANDFRLSNMGPDGNASLSAQFPAVAYNSTNNEYLVVWRGGALFGGESEIYGQHVDGATGAEVGANDFRLSDMGPDGDPNFHVELPAVAYNATNNEYLVVWSGNDIPIPNESEVYGQRLDGATGAEIGTNDFRLSDMGPDNDVNFGVAPAGVTYD